MKTGVNRGIKTEFGNELERLRRAQGLTQQAVAKSVGVTEQTYQNWIHGRRGKEFDVEVLRKVSEVLMGDFNKILRLARPELACLVESVNVRQDEKDVVEKILYILRNQEENVRGALSVFVDSLYEKRRKKK